MVASSPCTSSIQSRLMQLSWPFLLILTFIMRISAFQVIQTLPKLRSSLRSPSSSLNIFQRSWRLCSTTSSPSSPSTDPVTSHLSPRLVDFAQNAIRSNVQEVFEKTVYASEASDVAEQLVRRLFQDKDVISSNANLDRAVRLLSKAISVFPPEDIRQVASGEAEMDSLFSALTAHAEEGQAIFSSIIEHHRRLTELPWDSAMTDEDALKGYADSAVAMGQKSWVKEANDWMATFIVNYFMNGGAMKYYIKLLSNATPAVKPCRTALNLTRNLMFVPGEASANGQPYNRKIKVLDVGSCYNPLQNGPCGSNLDVTAVDLYPGDPSVYQCDFLKLQVGEKDSLPIIEVDPQNPQFKRVKQLPAESFDAVTMSLVLSYLPSPDKREQMIATARALLRSPPPPSSPATSNENPHMAGILLIIEKDSVFGRGKSSIDALYNQTTFLTSWKHSLQQSGFHLMKYFPLWATQERRRTHAFALAKAESLPAPNVSSDAVLQGLWIKQDFDLQGDGDKGMKDSSSDSSVNYGLFAHSSAPLPVGIVGGGIAGCALAVALEKQKMPYLLFERDNSFAFRKQGYALTIQQASMALNELELSSSVLANSATSLGHYSYDQHGHPLGAYGVAVGLEALASTSCSKTSQEELDGRLYDRKWVDHGANDARKVLSRHNIHIPRQRLRELMLDKIDSRRIHWDKRFARFEESGGRVEVRFADQTSFELSALVGADGIFSGVRRQIADELYLAKARSSATEESRRPLDLTYLNLMVVLGIVNIKSSRDGKVLCQRQWLDGSTRVFTMPFDNDHSMWQLSFPLTEEEAFRMSSMGGVGERCSEPVGRRLKAEALRRCAGWDPTLLAMIENADESLIHGHPVYDRNIEGTGVPCLNAESAVTLIGDAAHPMSPFKGQGANQALLDALYLSKALFSSNLVVPGRRTLGASLRNFEVGMAQRVKPKVDKSREAAVYLHSPIALTKANVTRASAAEQAWIETAVQK
eukprot:scaffold1463_cov189-Ochromonas_danica.AAC.5